jgi:hypothetical protein
MKEDDEGIRFHTLLTAGMHRGDRILQEKRRRRFCSWAAVLFLFVAALGIRGGARARRGGGIGGDSARHRGSVAAQGLRTGHTSE